VPSPITTHLTPGITEAGGLRFAALPAACDGGKPPRRRCTALVTFGSASSPTLQMHFAGRMFLVFFRTTSLPRLARHGPFLRFLCMVASAPDAHARLCICGYSCACWATWLHFPACLQTWSPHTHALHGATTHLMPPTCGTCCYLPPPPCTNSTLVGTAHYIFHTTPHHTKRTSHRPRDFTRTGALLAAFITG